MTLSIANGGVTKAMLANNAAVKSLNGKTNAITLSAGTNVNISESGSQLTISATTEPGPAGPQGPPGPQGLQGPVGPVGPGDILSVTAGRGLDPKGRG